MQSYLDPRNFNFLRDRDCWREIAVNVTGMYVAFDRFSPLLRRQPTRLPSTDFQSKASNTTN